MAEYVGFGGIGYVAVRLLKSGVGGLGEILYYSDAERAFSWCFVFPFRQWVLVDFWADADSKYGTWGDVSVWGIYCL